MSSGWIIPTDAEPLEIRKVPYYDRVGKRHGLMGFGRDITERKRYCGCAERASRDKTTFISTIGRRFRYTAERYRRPEPHPTGYRTHRRARSLKTIHVSAVTLGNIFNDIIDMDKMERRKVQLDNQPV